MAEEQMQQEEAAQNDQEYEELDSFQARIVLLIRSGFHVRAVPANAGSQTVIMMMMMRRMRMVM